MSHRDWCVTAWVEPKWDPELNKYLVYQKELCPNTGRIHWQTYVECKDKVRMRGMQKSLGLAKDQGHCWKRLGSREQARDYCMKADTRLEAAKEFGKFKLPEQGKRTDLEGACECKTIREVKENFPSVYAKFNRGLEKLIVEKDRDTMPRVMVFHGVGSGTGKSHAAKTWCQRQGLSFYCKGVGKWWDGYENEPVVIFDDFHPTQWGAEFNASWFKKFIDHMPVRVEPKGSSVKFNSPHVIFTSNLAPKDWYPEEKNQMTIMRRIAQVVDFGTRDLVWQDNETVVDQMIDDINRLEDLYGVEVVDVPAQPAGMTAQEIDEFLAEIGL